MAKYDVAGAQTSVLLFIYQDTECSFLCTKHSGSSTYHITHYEVHLKFLLLFYKKVQMALSCKIYE